MVKRVMKIIVTEQQAYRLNFIQEAANPLDSIEIYAKETAANLDKIYGKLININIQEILDDSLELNRVNELLDNVYYGIHEKVMSAYKFIDAMDEDGLDVRIDNAESLVKGKLEVLQEIIKKINELKNALSMYSSNEIDNKPLELGL